MAMDRVDDEIAGAEARWVEVEPDPGESAVGQAGSMMAMDPGTGMDTVFGGASGATAPRTTASCTTRSS